VEAPEAGVDDVAGDAAGVRQVTDRDISSNRVAGAITWRRRRASVAGA